MDRSELRGAFDAMLPQLGRLKEEALFTLEGAIREEGIKLHSLTARVKDTESFCEKAERKEYNTPLTQTEDMVGLRAVCLFLDDLSNLVNVASNSFSVVSQTNTVEVDPSASFGYSSVHLICKMSPDHTGPRYAGLENLVFEIQLRTLLMDAWANVSHYLAYKGEASIPDSLRRDFHALSGLFYVADKHFQLFFEASAVSQEAAALQAATGDLTMQLIDRDTLTAYAETALADRLTDGPLSDEALSALVEELTVAGLRTIGDLQEMMERARLAALASEKRRPPFGTPHGRFNPIGFMRAAMDIMHPEVRGDETPRSDFGHLVKPPS